MKENIRTFNLKNNAKLTDEQLKQIREAKKRPVVPDEDCPVYTPEQLSEMLAYTREKKGTEKGTTKGE